jgi:transcriptional regulator with XRE-family HTH domain
MAGYKVNPYIRKQTGERIKYIREKIMNMNLTEFSMLLETTKQNLCGIESGKHGFSIDILMKICDKTNTSADYILYGKSNFSNVEIQNLFLKLKEDNLTKTLEIMGKLTGFINANTA